MAGRQHISLELNDDLVDKQDLVQIMSNSHINDHFHSLAREVCLFVDNLILLHSFLNYVYF